MEKLQKICKFHGKLEEKDIRSEPTKRASKGYVLRCRLCDQEKSHKAYEKRRLLEDRKRNSLWNSGERICQIHGELKDDEVIIHKSSKNKNGLQIRCRKCVIETNWNTKFKRERKNTLEIARVNKLTLDEYQRMFENQGNVCKICKQSETRRSRREGEICRLVVDHCHSTMQVRGLLCHSCNLMIGYSKDSIEILQAAIRYLKAN